MFMTAFGFFALLSGALQLTVPSYALRLVHRFGTHRVGWFVVTAFASLAVLHCLHPMRLLAGVGSMPDGSMDLFYALASGFLLIGMGHLETLLSERLRADIRSRIRLRTVSGRISAHKGAASVAENASEEALATGCAAAVLPGAAKNEAVRQLAGCVGWQLSNSLAIINGHADLLRQNPREPATPEQLRQLSAAAQRATHVARQLLLLGGRYPAVRQSLRLDAMLLRLQPRLQTLLGPRIVLCVNTNGVPTPILADSRLVQHVLFILAGNARDAMPHGGRLTVTLQTLEIREPRAPAGGQAVPGRYACLSLRDTGNGISPGTQERLFEPFFTTKQAGKGLGLGLASVYGALRQLSGWIELSSEPGEGTEFRLYFPSVSHTPEPVCADR